MPRKVRSKEDDFLGFGALGRLIDRARRKAARPVMADPVGEYPRLLWELERLYVRLRARHRIASREVRMLRVDLEHLRGLVKNLFRLNNDLLAESAAGTRSRRRKGA